MFAQHEKPYRPKDIVEERKALSDAKNNTDKLTFESGNNDTRAAAYQMVRDKLDRNEISNLSAQTNEECMLKELNELEKEFLNEA